MVMWEKTMENEEIKEKLFSLADIKFKEFNKKLSPKINNMIGIRIPILKKYAKEIIKQDYKKYLDNAVDDYYEETMLQGIVIGNAKMDLRETQYYLKKFIPKINDWAVCDVTVADLKITNKYKEEMWNFIQRYIKSDKEFEIRFAVVMILNYYIDEKYIKQVLEILNNIKHEDYYVKMAVAWAIAEAFIKYPKETWKLINNNNLDKFTYNKALQKIIESYRVDNETKSKIRAMKRK